MTKRAPQFAETWLHMQQRVASPVKVYSPLGGDGLSGCIDLSSGTRIADGEETADPTGGPPYESGARLPREPWRAPTDDEAKALVTREAPRDMTSSVVLLRLPGEFSEDRRGSIKSGIEPSLEEHLLRPLRTICEIGEPALTIGPNKNPANLKTVTFNDRLGCYNGLHVDSWDQLGLAGLKQATNRVCFNIGLGDRYLLFLPFSVIDMAGVIAEELGPDWEVPRRHTAIGRKFMELFPEIPVVRCRLAPGEAYIAPTENLVHDGSSIGQVADDEQFTVRGHIGLL